MPTLRIFYLTEQSGATEYAARNTTAGTAPTNGIIGEDRQVNFFTTKQNTSPRQSIAPGREKTYVLAADETHSTSPNRLLSPAEEKRAQEPYSDHEDDDDYLDSLMQEAINSVNSKVAAREQFQRENLVCRDKDYKNDSSSSVLSEYEELEDETVQQISGNKRKRQKQSFDECFNDLMIFKGRHGHCDVLVPQIDEYHAFLSQWCNNLRASYEKIQGNQKPIMNLSNEQIQRLNDAGFNWSLKSKESFDNHFNDLMIFKGRHGHCDVPQTDEYASSSLSQWCKKLRASCKKLQLDQKPIMNLSNEQIQRLNDAGFKWCLQNKQSFDEYFNDLMIFKGSRGHCDVLQTDEYTSCYLSQWCRNLRASYGIKRNQKPIINLSNEQIRRLHDAGFKWSLKPIPSFDECFNDLMIFKGKYGHCDVPQNNYEYAPLSQWCKHLRVSYKTIHRKNLSNAQIQSLNCVGFKWDLSNKEQFQRLNDVCFKFGKQVLHAKRGTKLPKAFDQFGNHCNDLLAFKAKHGIK